MKLKQVNKFKVAVGTGVLLLIIGVSVWLYTDSVVKSHEQMLSSPNLTQEEIWSHEGSLQWWRAVSPTTFYPLAVISTTKGLLMTMCPILWAIIRKTCGHTIADDFQREIDRNLKHKERRAQA